MGKYYLLIAFASLLFSINTYFNKTYQKNEGESFEKLMLFMWVSSIFGIFIMLCLSGFKVKIDSFAVFMAILNSIAHLICTIIAMKCMSKVNLSLYSLFIMSGGMILPTLYGFAFNSEDLRLTKSICILFLIVALFISVGKLSDCKGLPYCIAVFFANGMYGVITSIYKTKSTVNIPDANYNMYVLFCSFIISSAMLLFILPRYKKEHDKSLFVLNKPKQSYSAAFFYILSNGIGNFLLLLALSNGVEVSIQYPVITGGTMIFSTVLSILLKEKVAKRNLISVAIAFVGLLAVCF